MPVKKFQIGNGTPKEWTDITNPDNDELDEIASKYHINRHVVRDCLDPNHLPKHENLKECTFFITRLVSGNIKTHLDSIHELTTKIAIFFNEDYVITVHRLEQPFVDEINEAEIEKGAGSCTANLVARIVWYVLQTFEQPAMILGEQIESYESTVLLKHTKPALLQGLYYIKRKASTCKKVLLLTDDLITFLKTTDADKSLVQDIRDMYTKLITLYDQVLDDVNNLLNTYLSLTTQKTNEVMKILTIFSVFFMPLTFIVGVYGMNFRYMPELTMKYGYPAVMIFMLMLVGVIFFWFKKKKWL